MKNRRYYLASFASVLATGGCASIGSLGNGASVGVAGTSAPSPATPSPATPAPAAKVTIEDFTIFSNAIAGNLEGNDPNRAVRVYLPPSYGSSPNRRYPVLYALHGYSIDHIIWAGEIKTPDSIDKAFAAGVPEMIVVTANARSRHNGSVYSSSVTTGNFEAFITSELVAYIDAHYRTLAKRESRGIAGHSMGGYGAIRGAMRHADTFSVLYAMSPGGIDVREPRALDHALEMEAATTQEAVAALPFWQRGTFAMAAAWSPNPLKPPLYLDLPTQNGVLVPGVMARWAANSPMAMLDQYAPPLRTYSGIALDVGDRDFLVADAQRFHDRLNNYGISNQFEIYAGDHVSEVAVRFEQHVLPFIASHLHFS